MTLSSIAQTTMFSVKKTLWFGLSGLRQMTTISNGSYSSTTSVGPVPNIRRGGGQCSLFICLVHLKFCISVILYFTILYSRSKSNYLNYLRQKIPDTGLQLSTFCYRTTSPHSLLYTVYTVL